MMFPRLFIYTLIAGLIAMPAIAQGTRIAFGDLQQDTSLPVEVNADQLSIDQADGAATFSGNVVVGQGKMRLAADKVRVEYVNNNGKSTGEISQLLAIGNVTLVNGDAAAEAQKAVYSIKTGTITLTGDVILTQGNNAMSSQRMVVELRSGSAIMDGRVRTILQTGDN